jgi:hypothetical protein
LIGEKLLNFLEVAESKPVWQAEVPHFIAKITEMFPAWQIAEFFEYLRRLGALGHVADEASRPPDCGTTHVPSVRGLGTA